VQLDRFAMKLSLGYTDRDAELEVISDRAAGDPVVGLSPVVNDVQLQKIIRAIRDVTVGENLQRYVVNMVVATREHPDLRLGVSTRGTLLLLSVARAYAVGRGRNWVSPDDIKAVAVPVLAHRLSIAPEAELDGVTSLDVLEQIIAATAVPR
jgi:MoxR-like ATPase